MIKTRLNNAYRHRIFVNHLTNYLYIFLDPNVLCMFFRFV